MTKRTYTIYALTDPRDNGVRYIGITVNPDERLKQHIWGDINIPKRDWIRELNQSGLAPIMCSIETAETAGRVTLDALITESGLKRVSLAAQSGVTTASIIRICQGAPTSRVTVIKLLRVLRNYLKRDIKIEDIDGLNITK